MNKRVWAKSIKRSNDETVALSEHIIDILSAFKKIKDKIGDDNLKKAIELAIVFHDLGKVIPRFQIVSLGNNSYEPYDLIHEIPHSLFSIFWIDEEYLKKEEYLKSVISDEKLVKFIVSAVAYHHWRENFEDYLNVNEETKKFLNWVLENNNSLKVKLEKEFEVLKNSINTDAKNLIEKIEIKINECKIKEVLNGVKLYRFAVPPYKFDYEPLRHTLTQSQEDQKRWILIAGFLQRCDHFASWYEAEGENLDDVEINVVGENAVKREIKTKIGIPDENQIWQIGVAKEHKNKNLILIAPTGYGKTEFAFLWSADNKFIYTLPLRSAVNQIFERAKNVFGEDKVGLLHSDADVHLLEKEGDVGDTMKYYQLAKNLSYPVIISTGDQFFPYALKPPGYEKIFSLFSYTNLVIDEVQAYDPVACAIIVKFIEWVNIMGGKFLLMTATLPEFVNNEIKERIGEGNFEEINIYEEEEKFNNIIKHKLNFLVINNENNVFELPDEILDEIINKAQQGKRVLVIMNTVLQAQKVYERLKEKAPDNMKNNIFLIHSRFTYEDRRNKEVELIEEKFKNPKPQNENEGKILVATQVVEASLDIDADVLYTEICPLDALIQRMGRVLRRYFYMNGKLLNKSNNENFNLDNKQDVSGGENIHILIFKNGLESGNGRIYDKELLKLSLAWLWKKSQGDISDIQIEDLMKFFDEHFKELINEQENETGEGKKKKRNSGSNKQNVYDLLLREDKWINKLDNMTVELSEYDKYKLVELFYKSLSGESEYRRKFYETLEILEAGYMSERKSEAQRTFRKIYDVDVVPANLIKKLIDEVNKFFNKPQGKSFTSFKSEVLSKFVVSVPYRDTKRADWIYYDVEKELQDDNIKKRLKSWLSGIYKIDKNYDEEKGMLR
ncbi:CRISPR-associated helicase Cas3' [Hydrogenobacter thermophilus]|uniref:CRISPR-associated helicase Cas3' n=1 Tax=Hydrogenobacter thermophilus TaxID=940 RepID=UPI0030FA62CD